jgi:hypothetical protein
MSHAEENIQSTSKEDHSLWEKFKNFLVNDYSKFIDDREDQDEKAVRIAVIGKTRVGKGSFINAIRAIKKSKEKGDEFEVQGPSADVTDGILPGPIVIEEYEYQNNEKNKIFFYDTGGYADAYNENYSLEDALKKYQKENKIKFDAIIFMIDSNNLGKTDIEPLKDQENKAILVLYIANQVDVLKFKIKNEEKFQKEKGKIKGNILELLKKNEVNRHDFSKNNIYLISSNLSDFENEDVSPDGKRIKAELIELLSNIKIGKPLDLFNPFTRQLISYKAKIMKDKISKNAYYSAIKSSPIAIIPFADIFVQNKIVSDYKDVFLKEFGIKPVMDWIKSEEDMKIKKNDDLENSDHHVIISKNTDKWKKIKILVDEINANKILEAIKFIFKNDITKLTKEKIQAVLNQTGMLLGGTVAGFWDDIAAGLGRLGAYLLKNIGGTTIKIGASIIAFVAFPIAIGIYIKFCHFAIMKVIVELTNYAIKIHDVLHE